MNPLPRLEVVVAGPADAEAWMTLQGHADDDPEERARDLEAFQTAPPQVARNRFIGRLAGCPVACFSLLDLDTVVEIKELVIVPEHRTRVGPAVLCEALALARRRGSLVTAAYPAAYSPIFLQGGFEQHTRRQMRISLRGFQPRPATLPLGIRLRHPHPDDEQAVAALAYRNYQDTVDSDWVSASQAQAAAIMRAIFGEEYAVFARDCSFLAEGDERTLVGAILLGDLGASPRSSIIWILDLSVAPDRRGQGLGRALMVHALKAAQAHGFSYAGLTVTSGNDRALALYRAMGFKESGSLLYESAHRLGA